MSEGAECIFCEIVAGRSPASIMYEDERTIAFMNIRAINPGECMIIPKQHIDHFTDIPDDLSGHIMVCAQKIGRRIMEHFKPQRIGYVVHGYGVPHAHLLIVPQHDPHDIISAKFIRLIEGQIVFDDQHIPLIPRSELDETARRLSIQ